VFFWKKLFPTAPYFTQNFSSSNFSTINLTLFFSKKKSKSKEKKFFIHESFSSKLNFEIDYKINDQENYIKVDKKKEEK